MTDVTQQGLDKFKAVLAEAVKRDNGQDSIAVSIAAIDLSVTVSEVAIDEAKLCGRCSISLQAARERGSQKLRISIGKALVTGADEPDPICKEPEVSITAKAWADQMRGKPPTQVPDDARAKARCEECKELVFLMEIQKLQEGTKWLCPSCRAKKEGGTA